MKSSTFGALVVVVLLAIGVFAFAASSDSDDEQTNETATNQSANETSTNGSTAANIASGNNNQTFTAAMVAEHAEEGDCWTIIDGEVYDITSYIPRHPGGDEILRACGTDGSSLFNSRTTADGETVGSGTSHSSRASGQLDDFKVGSLAN